METQIRKFRLLNIFIDMKMFYVITIYKDYIQLQGCAKENTFKNLDHLFQFKWDEVNHWFFANRNDISVTLTLGQ